jgi:hypothetical protein
VLWPVTGPLTGQWLRFGICLVLPDLISISATRKRHLLRTMRDALTAGCSFMQAFISKAQLDRPHDLCTTTDLVLLEVLHTGP